MKLGINIPNFGEYFDPQTVVELAQEAEKAGWDGFFLWDHIGWMDSPIPMNDPWVVLSAIAAKTKRIRFGPLITPLPRRRPWKLARETVSLDHLSNGRLILGIGLGYPPDTEFEFFGEEPDSKIRAKKLDEGLAILTGLWSGKPFHYHGEAFTLQEMTFLPSPVQSPRIPIWIAGTWPYKAPFWRAAQWDGVVPEMNDPDHPMTPDILQEVIEYIQSYRTKNTPFDIIIGGETPGEDLSEQYEILSPYKKLGVTWWSEDINGRRGSLKEMRERIRQGPPKVKHIEV